MFIYSFHQIDFEQWVASVHEDHVNLASQVCWKEFDSPEKCKEYLEAKRFELEGEANVHN